MKILHYALGFPPYRSGGLTKYVIDLMREQQKQGDEISLLWPGAYGILKKGCWIKKKSDQEGIHNYELRNPLPVPLLDGICDIPRYMKKGNLDMYRDFLRQIDADVIHVHTLMGVHKEFFEAAAEQKIPIVYTAHDYFPVCPKVTLFCGGKVCSGIGERCVLCNRTALPFWKIIFLQSAIYRTCKDCTIVKKLRSSHKKKKISREVEEKNTTPIVSGKEYTILRHFYEECLSYVTCIHYASHLTAEQYKKCGIQLPGYYLPVTHSEIKDQRKLKIPNEKIQFAFLADTLPYKGFRVLCEAMDELWTEGIQNFQLHVYSQNAIERIYILKHKPYLYKEIDTILEGTDMVLVPSQCRETFGLVVLEALSHGVPVLVSENVGAKEILNNGKKGVIVQPDKMHIKEAIEFLCKNPDQIKVYSQNILDNSFDYSLVKHSMKIRRLYSCLQKEKEL